MGRNKILKKKKNKDCLYKKIDIYKFIKTLLRIIVNINNLEENLFFELLAFNKI